MSFVDLKGIQCLARWHFSWPCLPTWWINWLIMHIINPHFQLPSKKISCSTWKQSAVKLSVCPSNPPNAPIYSIIYYMLMTIMTLIFKTCRKTPRPLLSCCREGKESFLNEACCVEALSPPILVHGWVFWWGCHCLRAMMHFAGEQAFMWWSLYQRAADDNLAESTLKGIINLLMAIMRGNNRRGETQSLFNY